METEVKQRRSVLEKVLLGCAFGCGGLIVLSMIAGSMGAYWFFTPGEQVPTARIVGEESVGLIRMNELATDPGTQALLSKVLETLNEESQREQQRNLPESMRWMSQFQRPTRARDLNRFIPKEVTLILESRETQDGPGNGHPGEPDVVVAANFRTMVRPVKAILSLVTGGENKEELQSRYRDHDVFNLSAEEVVASFVGSTFLISNSELALHRAIDRIVGVVPGGAARFDREVPEGTWDAAGVVADEGGAALALIREALGNPDFEPPPGASSELDLRFGLDVVSADEMKARVFLDCQSEDQALAWLEVLEKEFESLRGRVAEWGVDLEIEAEAQGERVSTLVRLTGFEKAIENMVQF